MEINLPINDWTFTAEIRNLNNYYPYGMQLPSGMYNQIEDYSYGYNGMEKEQFPSLSNAKEGWVTPKA